MRRRDFITLVGGTAAAWPFAARAQPPDKLPTIAVVGDRASAWSPWTAAFLERLREFGWIEGRTIGVEYHWSEGRFERVAEIASELVQQKVDVIVTNGGGATILKQVTASIPIVFATATDPVGSGLVASLARPGGNVTGLSNQGADIASKRLELLRLVVPGLRRLAVMFDANYSGAVLESGQVHAAARTLGLEVALHAVKRAEDFAPVIDALKGQAEALYVVENALIGANGAIVITRALNAQLPTTFLTSDLVRAGGLMSYGPNIPDQFRRAAVMVDKILRGTKPGDIPVEQPTKFDLVINLTTAKALRLNVPPNVSSLADELIE